MKTLITSLVLALALIGCAGETAPVETAPVKAQPDALEKNDLKKEIKKDIAKVAPKKAPAIAGPGCNLFGTANATVTCPVKITGNMATVAMQMDALFDASKLKFKGVTCSNGGNDTCTSDQKLSSGHSVKTNDLSQNNAGQVKLLTFSATSLDPMATNNGTLFELNFTLAQDIAESAAEKIDFAGLIFSSDKGQPLAAQLQNGMITLQ